MGKKPGLPAPSDYSVAGTKEGRQGGTIRNMVCR